MSEEKMDRRGFLKASSILGVGSVVGASALLAACGKEEKMVPLADMIVEKDLSVREVEALVRKYNTVPEEIPETEETNSAMQRRIYMKDLEDRMRTHLGRKVKIHDSNRKKTVELTFENDEDLEALLEALAGQNICE